MSRYGTLQPRSLHHHIAACLVAGYAHMVYHSLGHFIWPAPHAECIRFQRTLPIDCVMINHNLVPASDISVDLGPVACVEGGMRARTSRRACRPCPCMHSRILTCPHSKSMRVGCRLVDVCLWAFLICYVVSGPTSAPPSDPPLTPLSIDELREIAHARANWATRT